MRRNALPEEDRRHCTHDLLMTGPRTCDTDIAGLQIGSEVSLARPYVYQRAHTDVARLASGALGVEQRDDVVGTAKVVVAADAASQSHPAVHR